MSVSKMTSRREFLRLTVVGAIGTAIAAACSTPASPPTSTTAPPAPTATIPPPTATSAAKPAPTPPPPTAVPKPTDTPAPAPTPTAAAKPTQARRAVSLAGFLSDEFLVPLTNSFKPFTDSTGISVDYSKAPELAATDLQFTWIESGDTSDALLTWTPNMLLSAAKRGKVVDLSKALGAQVLKDAYDQPWLDWATMAGPSGTIVGGLFTLSFLQGVVWYPKAEYDKAGYKVPATWSEMVALSDRIVKAGGAPWGLPNGGPLWLNMLGPIFAGDVLLRTASLEDYDKHWQGKLKFSSPQVKKAVQTMGDLWLKPGHAFGGKEYINAATWSDLTRRLFASPPNVWMFYGPSYLPMFNGSSSATNQFRSKTYGADYDFFLLPTIDKAYGAPVQVESHVVSLLRDTDDARALMSYVASGAHGEAYVKQGNTLGGTPRKGAKLEWYPDAYTRRVAEVIQKADKLRMLAYDLIPWPVVYQLWKSQQDYIDGKATLDSALKKIDDAWASAG